MTELLEALYRGDDDRVSELLAADPELTVFEAAAFGRTDRLRELLDEHPAQANAFGDDGFQPLGLACFFGHAEAARLLLDRGADPNTLARNEHIQAGPLHSASASENKDAETRYEHVELALPDPHVRGDVLELEAPRLREREIVVGPTAHALADRLHERLDHDRAVLGPREDRLVDLGQLGGDLLDDLFGLAPELVGVGLEEGVDRLSPLERRAELLHVQIGLAGEE